MVSTETEQLPTKILYPVDFFPLSDPTHQELIEEFVTVLERYLNTTRTEVNLTAEWSKSAVVDAKGQVLQEYMAKVRVCGIELSLQSTYIP